MPPDEHIDIDSVILNGSDGSTPWWCDFDLSVVPIWGTRVSKGDPTIPIPHADGDLNVPVNLGAADFTLLGVVYGEYDQDGDPVSGFESQRIQLADNIAVIMGLPGPIRTFTYHLYDRLYVASCVVTGTQGTSSSPLEQHPTGPIAQPVAVRCSIGAGQLALTGS